MKVRPKSCFAQVLGVGERKVLPNKRRGWRVLHWESAFARSAVIFAGPEVREYAALAVGDNVGTAGVGRERKRKEVAKGPSPPRGSTVNGSMAML
jgi:hypothetical protein